MELASLPHHGGNGKKVATFRRASDVLGVGCPTRSPSKNTAVYMYMRSVSAPCSPKYPIYFLIVGCPVMTRSVRLPFGRLLVLVFQFGRLVVVGPSLALFPRVGFPHTSGICSGYVAIGPGCATIHGVVDDEHRPSCGYICTAPLRLSAMSAARVSTIRFLSDIPLVGSPNQSGTS